ncbi:MAG: diaminopimelate epimerase, partial [Halobacteria archaeon]|nr:diaminopimelate epimerase [Halobacteria archaeon]
VVFVDDVSELDVAEEAPRVRHANVFDEGANVNFVSETREGAGYEVRTFERGVEDETLSCGTGAVAVAAAARRLGKAGGDEVTVRTSGGELRITFDDGTAYMEGPAERVYEGSLDEEWMEG